MRWRGITAALRLDSAVYFAPPSPAYLASQDVAPDRSAAECPGEALQTCYDRKLLEYERALLNRYRSTVYPSKVSVTTTRPGWELTLGDFYAQFGRGLVLSIRKVDEFAYDTTVRGAKVDATWQGARVRVDGTVLAGLANPVRVDEISGRRLTAPGSWVFPAMPTYDAGAAFAPAASETFRPDGILGARVAAGTDRVMVGAQASMIARGGLEQLAQGDDVAAVAFRTGAHPARQVKYLETASLSLSLPRLGDNMAAYVEGAVQGFDPASSPFGAAAGDSHAFTGYAVTGSLSWARDALSALLEVRHTRRFSPLMANVDVGRANEFFGLQYSAPRRRSPSPPTPSSACSDTARQAVAGAPICAWASTSSCTSRSAPTGRGRSARETATRPGPACR